MLHADEYPSSSSDSSPSPQLENMDFDATPEKAVFGIDLGGTRTRVSIMRRSKDAEDEDDLEPMIIKDIPSVVSFLKDGKCLVGWAAAKRTVASPLNTFHATKRLIGRRYDDPVVQEIMNRCGYKIHEYTDGQTCFLSSNRNRVLTAPQIETLILLKLKEFCEKELNTIPLENIVLTVPPYFNDNQTQVIKEAASIAGLNVLGVINTPVAAVLAHSETHETLHGSKTVVVYDFGGSTFHVTVLKLTEDATDPEVLSTQEDLSLGGDDIDKKLVDYLVTELERQTGINARLLGTLMQCIKLSAENAKIDLCAYPEVDVNFWAIRLPGLEPRVKRITIKVTRNHFEELIAELINKTISLCQNALEEAKISTSDIDEVLAIGGTCKIPKVRATIEEIFGKEPIGGTRGFDRANSVAVGAAIRAHDLISEISNVQQPPDHLISIPKPVMEGETFHYEIMDDEPDMDAIAMNCVQSNIITIYTAEEADSLLLKEYNADPGNSTADKDVNYIIAYGQLTEKRRSVDEVHLPQELEDILDVYRQGRDKYVKKELTRMSYQGGPRRFW
ncbi:heat shock 70 kDa protein cognate 5-like [Planococcus citri]|uniref:heat shock 70 kDa protein cognate 5-like n=1 Tax=Planococcus citri TaxID=170843 RepID=UPI0031F9EFB3